MKIKQVNMDTKVVCCLLLVIGCITRNCNADGSFDYQRGINYGSYGLDSDSYGQQHLSTVDQYDNPQSASLSSEQTPGTQNFQQHIPEASVGSETQSHPLMINAAESDPLFGAGFGIYSNQDYLEDDAGPQVRDVSATRTKTKTIKYSRWSKSGAYSGQLQSQPQIAEAHSHSEHSHSHPHTVEAHSHSEHSHPHTAEAHLHQTYSPASQSFVYSDQVYTQPQQSAVYSYQDYSPASQSVVYADQSYLQGAVAQQAPAEQSVVYGDQSYVQGAAVLQAPAEQSVVYADQSYSQAHGAAHHMPAAQSFVYSDQTYAQPQTVAVQAPAAQSFVYADQTYSQAHGAAAHHMPAAQSVVYSDQTYSQPQIVAAQAPAAQYVMYSDEASVQPKVEAAETQTSGVVVSGASHLHAAQPVVTPEVRIAAAPGHVHQSNMVSHSQPTTVRHVFSGRYETKCRNRVECIREPIMVPIIRKVIYRTRVVNVCPTRPVCRHRCTMPPPVIGNRCYTNHHCGITVRPRPQPRRLCCFVERTGGTHCVHGMTAGTRVYREAGANMTTGAGITLMGVNIVDWGSESAVEFLRDLVLPLKLNLENRLQVTLEAKPSLSQCDVKDIQCVGSKLLQCIQQPSFNSSSPVVHEPLRTNNLFDSSRFGGDIEAQRPNILIPEGEFQETVSVEEYQASFTQEEQVQQLSFVVCVMRSFQSGLVDTKKSALLAAKKCVRMNQYHWQTVRRCVNSAAGSETDPLEADQEDSDEDLEGVLISVNEVPVAAENSGLQVELCNALFEAGVPSLLCDLVFDRLEEQDAEESDPLLDDQALDGDDESVEEDPDQTGSDSQSDQVPPQDMFQEEAGPVGHVLSRF